MTTAGKIKTFFSSSSNDVCFNNSSTRNKHSRKYDQGFRLGVGLNYCNQ
jgi:hypothetical protein